MAGSFDGTLKFDTAIDQSGFEKGISSIGNLAKKGMAIVTGAITAAGTAVSALGGYAVSVGKDFESSMAQVIATMGVTKDTIYENGVTSYELLKEAAAAAGETTTFSASEAADALNYLALAGYDAAKAAEALPAVLDLAAAGGLELARASDLATDAMAALGIEATSDNLTEFGDKLAKTASKANTSVAQLGEAILTVGGTAKSLAGGTTELNAVLGVLANRGIKAAEGGTHLRNMILSLSAPTDTARKALDSLGVSALDADGTMRPLNETFADLDKALAGMSDGDKAAILSDIFNKTDLSAAQALLAGCGEEFDSLTAALNNCDGAMADMKATMTDTLEGDLKSLSSKAEAFGIAIYENLNEPLRDLAKMGGEYITQLTDAFKEGGFEGLLSGLGSVLADAVTELSGYIPKFVEMGVSLVSSLVSGLIESAPQIAEAAISAGVQLLDGIMSISGDLLELGMSLITTLLQGIVEKAPALAEAAVNAVSALIEGISSSLPAIIEAVISIVVAIGEALIANIPTLVKAVVSAIPLIINALIGCIPDLINGAVQLFMALVEALPIVIETLIEELPNIIVTVVEALIEATPQILEAAGQMFMAIVEALPQILVALVEGLGNLLSKIGEFLKNVIISIAEWAIELRQKAIDAAKGFFDSIVEFFKELPGKIWEFLKSAVASVVDWALEMRQNAIDTAKGFLDSVVTFFKELPGKIWDTLTTAIKNVISWGLELREKAKNAASDMFHNIVDTIKELPGKMLDIGKNLVEGLWNGIKNMGQWIKDKIFGFADGIIDGFKGVFGIHSPSTVMRDSVGRYLAEGIGEGFMEELPGIADEARKALEGLDLGRPNVGFDIDAPVPKLPELEISIADIPLPKIPNIPKTIFDNDPDDRQPRPAVIAPDALIALEAKRTTLDSSFAAPSATSEIINNQYTYNSSTTNNTGADTEPRHTTINATLMIGEDIVAEGMADLIGDEIDEKQGLRIQMKRRGVTT